MCCFYSCVQEFSAIEQIYRIQYLLHGTIQIKHRRVLALCVAPWYHAASWHACRRQCAPKDGGCEVEKEIVSSEVMRGVQERRNFAMSIVIVAILYALIVLNII
jgi:hypothetical protein